MKLYEFLDYIDDKETLIKVVGKSGYCIYHGMVKNLYRSKSKSILGDKVTKIQMATYKYLGIFDKPILKIEISFSLI